MAGARGGSQGTGRMWKGKENIMEEKQNKNIFFTAWQCIYPVGIHFLLSMMLGFAYIFVGVFVLCFQEGMKGGTASALVVQEIVTKVTDSYLANGCYVILLQSLICIPLFWFLIKGRRKKEANPFGQKKLQGKDCAVLVVVAVCMCISLNMIISATGLDKLFPGYQDVANTIYSGGIMIELIAVGVVVPICEELMFRGLIFEHLNYRVSLPLAVAISAVGFGLYHGNFVQFVYATILGSIMALFCRKYESLLAPVTLHISANVTSVLVTETELLSKVLNTAIIQIVLIILTTLAWMGISWLLLKKNFRKKMG